MDKLFLPFLVALDAVPWLGSLLVRHEFAGYSVFVVRSLLTPGSEVPTPADEVEDNLIPVDGITTVGDAAAERLTGPNVFIKVRLPSERGQFPLDVLTCLQAPTEYTAFDSALEADRSEYLPPGAVDREHWWLNYAMFMHSSFLDALDATRLEDDGRDLDLLEMATKAATCIRTFPLAGKTCTEPQLTERLRTALAGLLAPLHVSPAASPPSTSTSTSTASAAGAAAPAASMHRPTGKPTSTTSSNASTELSPESVEEAGTMTDGSVVVDSGVFAAPSLVLNIEGKLHSHPGTQNDVYVCLHAAFTDRQGRPLNSRAATGTLHVPVVLLDHVPGQPCFMLNVYGGHLLELRVAAWAGPTLCSAVIAVAPMHSCSGPGYDQLVKLLYGLVVGVRALHACYDAAATAARTVKRVVPLMAPHVHELIHRDILARVVSPGDSLHLTAHVKRNVFHGRLRRAVAAPTAAGVTGSGDPTAQPVIVKFASSYGSAVHTIVAAAKRAPTLHACVKLGSWNVVVMDELSEEDGWRHLHDASVPASAVDVAAAEYRRVFVDPASGQRLVHGDARGPNILIRCTPGSATTMAPEDIMFFDFEYAGEEGKARFPANASKHAYEPVLRLLAAARGGGLLYVDSLSTA